MKLRLLAVLSVAAALVASGCSGKDAVDQSAGGQFRFVSGTSLGKTYQIPDRKKAGDFTGKLLDGGSLSLAQDAGKVVVINFWATWCGPCITETPQFDSVYRSYKAKGVAFIGVDTKNSPSSLAKAFVRDNDISYPIVYDEQGETALRLGKIPALSLPFTVLIDKHGKVAAVYLLPLTPKDLEPVLGQLLTEA
jgi:thiol-disulfide isomerase/thioredoxin